MGEVVEVRPPEEILAALEDSASTRALPFMPEMLQFVGRRFSVSAVAQKLCDTRSDGTGNRLLRDTVYLDDLRCDGSAHGGCQAGCRLLWRAEWLRPVSAGDGAPANGDSAELAGRAHAATTRASGAYRCQATELGAASDAFPAGDRGRKYLHELQCGNVGFGRFARVLLRAVSRKLGSMLRLQREIALWSAQPKSSDPLHLRSGDLVKVKSKREIARTLDANGKNKGLAFDWEMLPHCGRTYRVRNRIERFIDENDGTMVELKNPCVILDGVACSGDWSAGRWFCPRAIYPYWREDWLRRA